MKFYNEKEPLYLETDASGVGLGPGLLQVRDRMNYPADAVPNNTKMRPTEFASMSLSSIETHYSTSDGEALGIPQNIKKFHH